MWPGVCAIPLRTALELRGAEGPYAIASLWMAPCSAQGNHLCVAETEPVCSQFGIQAASSQLSKVWLSLTSAGVSQIHLLVLLNQILVAFRIHFNFHLREVSFAASFLQAALSWPEEIVLKARSHHANS